MNDNEKLKSEVENDCCAHEHHHDHDDCCGHEHEHHEHHHEHEHHNGHEHGDCCGHEHHHDHDGGCCGHEHGGDEKPNLKPYIVSCAVFLLSYFAGKFSPFVILAATVICGYEVFVSGIKSLLKFKFNEATLILVAAVASMCIGEYPESFMITLLFSIGELIEDYAAGKSRSKIEELINITDDTAYNELGEKIDAESIKKGDILLIKPGDKVCVDAKIIKGSSSFDTSNLTGESIPADKNAGDEVLSGSLNLTSSVVCEATSDYSNSIAAKIKEYVQSSSQKKAESEKFITKFARIYTPTIIGLAIVLAVALPFFGVGIKDAVIRALTFMIASCPCALVISIPLSYFGAIGASSKLGVLIKGSKFINTLAKADAIAFDKTGTLTMGQLKVRDVKAFGDAKPEDVLRFAVSLEKTSSHPIAKAIVSAYEPDVPIADDIREIFGKGIGGTVDGKKITIGNEKITEGMTLPDGTPDGICVYVCEGEKVIGEIILDDEIRSDAKQAVIDLKKLGFTGIYMLSGDAEGPVRRVCGEIGGIEGISSLLPTEKTEKIAELKSKYKGIIYVGDGVNDAPSLSASDFGISMGSASGLALEAGDATLLTSNLRSIPKAVSLARYTTMIVYTNIVFSLLVKLVVLILAALGYAPIWLALLADVGVMIIAVLRAVSVLGKVK